MLDIILSACGAVVNLALVYLGLHVALKPPEKQNSARTLLLISIGGSALALAISLILVVRSARDRQKSEESERAISKTIASVDGNVQKVLVFVSPRPEKQHVSHGPNVGQLSSSPIISPSQNGFIQFLKVSYTPRQVFFAVGAPLEINIFYVNNGTAPLSKVFVTGNILLMPRTDLGQAVMDKEAKYWFLKGVRTLYTVAESNVGVGDALWVTPGFDTPLEQGTVDSIIGNQTVLYVLGYARWTDSTQKRSEIFDCRWLQPPASTHPDLLDLVWHTCY
jgi:hypothetical protein